MTILNFINFRVKKLLSAIVGLVFFASLNIAIAFPVYATSSLESFHNKIVIYMVVEEKLKNNLQPLEDKVATANQQANVKNTYHISLIHLTNHVFTPKEFNTLLVNVKKVAESVQAFDFSTDLYAFLDEDNDVGLTLNMDSHEYQNLMTYVKHIPLPDGTQVKDYNPHVTVYYDVKNEFVAPVKEILESYKFDADKKYTVTEIGVGDLG